MKTVLLGLSLDGNLVKPLTSFYGTEWRDRGYGLWTWEFVIGGSWTGKNWKTEMVCFWRHSSLWQFSFWDRTEHSNCGFSLTLHVNSNFLFNKQLFSSSKIRRFMVSWTKCWGRKSPTLVKNLGNIRGWNLPVSASKKSAEYLYGGLIRYLTSIASRAVSGGTLLFDNSVFEIGPSIEIVVFL